MKSSVLIFGLLLAATSLGDTPKNVRSLVDERPNWWSIKATFPASIGKSPLGRFAATTIATEQTRAWNDFRTRAKTELPDLRKTNSDAQYGFESTTVVRLVTQSLISVDVSTYVFTAGAHGIDVVMPINFGFRDGKPTKLKLNDLLFTSGSFRHDLELKLLGKAMNLPGADWVEDGAVNNFSDAQLECVGVTKEGLTWQFPPYALGSYAAGAFAITLSWSELGTLVRQNGPLKALIKP